MLGVDSFESVLGLCLSSAERVRSRLSDLFDGVTRIACMSSVVVCTVTTLTIGYVPKAKCSPTKIHNSLLRNEIFPRCDHHLIGSSIEPGQIGSTRYRSNRWLSLKRSWRRKLGKELRNGNEMLKSTLRGPISVLEERQAFPSEFS